MYVHTCILSVSITRFHLRNNCKNVCRKNICKYICIFENRRCALTASLTLVKCQAQVQYQQQQQQIIPK